MVLRIVLLIPFLAMPLPFCFGQGQPDYHRITQRSNLSGSVSGPGGMVPIKGEAIVEYDERILERLATGEPVRTVRHYAKAKLVRDQAGQAGEGYLRAALNPIVILRQGTTEVPFSPRGPMTLGEVDLLRTDVFVGALSGMLPPSGTKSGGSWLAPEAAIRELTDLEKVQKGSLSCTLSGPPTGPPSGPPSGPPTRSSPGRITFQGSVEGPQEEGLARHEIKGSLEPDGAGGIRQLDMVATQILLGPGGTERGRIVGRFTLDRKASVPASFAPLSDASLAGLKLTPDETNTRLQVEVPHVGLGFTMSRRWRVIGQDDKQIRFGLPGGAEMLLTLEGGDRLPGLGELVQEGKAQLQKEKHQPGEPTPPVAKDGKGVRLDFTTIGVQLADGKQERWIYGVSRLQNASGGLFAGRFPRLSWPFWEREIEELQRLGISLYKLAK